MYKSAITCIRCFFAFQDDFLKKKHICPACGTVIVLKDDIEDMEPKYYYNVEKPSSRVGLTNM